MVRYTVVIMQPMQLSQGLLVSRIMKKPIILRNLHLKEKELIEFRLGFIERGYAEFCKKCWGFTSENNADIELALQTKIVV